MYSGHSNKHTFPIIGEKEIINNTILFIQKGLKSKEHSVKKYSLGLILDFCRPEFPTNSVRDIFTCYKETSRSMEHKWYSNNKIYTSVILCLPSVHPFKEFNRKIKTFCESNNLLEYFSNVIRRNIIIDVLVPPLEKFTYFRTRTSGKFFPRIFSDKTGKCFDPLGIKLSDYSYDMKTHVLTEISSGFKFIVPSHECNVKIETYFENNCTLSYLYGKLGEKLFISNEVKKAFNSMFKFDDCSFKGIDYNESLIYNPKNYVNTIFYDTNLARTQINNIELLFNTHESN